LSPLCVDLLSTSFTKFTTKDQTKQEINNNSNESFFFSINKTQNQNMEGTERKEGTENT